MATLGQIGIPGVGNGILHPKHKNRWRITFAGMAGAAATADLSLQAISASRPSLTFEEIKLDRYNSTAYIGGKHSWDPLTVTVEDDITGRASIVVQQQLEMQQKLIGADGAWLNASSSASGYKFATKLEMLDGNEGVIETWRMEGCWIQNSNYGDLDYSASEAVTIALTVRFDHARQDLTGSGLGTALGGNAA